MRNNEGDGVLPRRRGRPRKTMQQSNGEKRYTVGEGAVYLGITDKTLRKYLGELKFEPIPHHGDQRMKYYSQSQLNTLADAKGLVPGQKPPTVRSLAVEIRNLQFEVEELREALDALRQQVAGLHALPTPTPLPAPEPPTTYPSKADHPTLRQFVSRHLEDQSDERVSAEFERAARLFPDRVQVAFRRGQAVRFDQQTRLVNFWVGQAGYHKCHVQRCPCQNLLPA